MCDVHLIESGRESIAHWSGSCSYCCNPINGPAAIVRGTLDDGSPGIVELHYHPDCLDGFEYEGIDDNDGCFSYGTPTAVLV